MEALIIALMIVGFVILILMIVILCVLLGAIATYKRITRGIMRFFNVW